MKKSSVLNMVTGILMIATIAQFGNAAGWELNPYLQAVTTNSVYVLVEMKTIDPVQVRYGTTSLDQTAQDILAPVPTKASTPTYIHRIRLSGLSAHTVYRYQVVQNSLESAVHRFVTAALPGTAFRFAWMADSRSGIKIHEEIAGRMKAAAPDFSLYGGDLCGTASHSRWLREYFTPNERALIAEVPFFLATGNHEQWGPNTQAYTVAPESASGSAAFFSFDYGDAHFLVINTEIPVTPGSPQYKFIQKDMTAVKRPWNIVIAHRPAYSVGGHGENEEMIAVTKSILKPAGVDLVISGHSHFYQHNLVDGIHHLVIGTAGAPFMKAGTAGYTLKSVESFNYAVTDVSTHKLHLVVYDDKGLVLDTLDLQK